MAYIPQLPENQKNQFARDEESTATPTPPQTGGSAGEGGGGQGSGAAPGVGTSTQFGSNAAKLSDYLKANQPQVEAYGQEVAGDLGKRYSSAMGAIDTGFGNFNQAVNQGYAKQNQDLVNQAASNPSQFIKDPNNVSQFKSLWNNEYKGPQNFQSFGDYSNINDTVNKAVQDASLVGSQGGLESYLKNFMGAKQTTGGMNALNTALLQRSPESRTAIQQAAVPFQNLSSYLSGKEAEGNKSVADAKTAAQQAQEATRNKFVGPGGVLEAFGKGVDDKTAQARSKAQERYQDALAFLPDIGRVTRSVDYQPYVDIVPDRGDRFTLGKQMHDVIGSGRSFDLAPYLQFMNPESAITNMNVANADDYATAQALAQLTETNPFLSPETLAQAGTVNTDLTDLIGWQQPLQAAWDEVNKSGDLYKLYNPPAPPTPPPPTTNPDAGTGRLAPLPKIGNTAPTPVTPPPIPTITPTPTPTPTDATLPEPTPKKKSGTKMKPS